jgi:hypothetical protein
VRKNKESPRFPDDGLSLLLRMLPSWTAIDPLMLGRLLIKRAASRIGLAIKRTKVKRAQSLISFDERLFP